MTESEVGELGDVGQSVGCANELGCRVEEQEKKRDMDLNLCGLLGQEKMQDDNPFDRSVFFFSFLLSLGIYGQTRRGQISQGLVVPGCCAQQKQPRL